MTGRSMAAAAAVLTAATVGAQEPTSAPAIGFDHDTAGKAPASFSFGRTGGGAPGRWVVRTESDAPSPPNVLAQLDADPTDYRFPIAVADAPAALNLEASVKCKPVSGKVDEACGLVFRYRDENDYYIARANALENDTRLYVVRGGRRHQIGSARGKVAAGVWHELAVRADGDHLQVFFDRKRIIDAHDATFTTPGKVGVWTKADSVTYFDDLVITPK